MYLMKLLLEISLQTMECPQMVMEPSWVCWAVPTRFKFCPHGVHPVAGRKEVGINMDRESTEIKTGHRKSHNAAGAKHLV